jgi:hypothetical protein
MGKRSRAGYATARRNSREINSSRKRRQSHDAPWRGNKKRARDRVPKSAIKAPLSHGLMEIKVIAAERKLQPIGMSKCRIRTRGGPSRPVAHFKAIAGLGFGKA